MADNRDKDRVYVTIYFQGGGQSQNADNTPNYTNGYSRFHWAIFIQEKKDLTDTGTLFQVTFEKETAHSTQGMIPAHWLYTNFNAGVARSQLMLGRFLVGKRPSNVTIKDINIALTKIDLPKIGVEPLQNCVTWTMEALVVLQNMGCVKEFNIPKFFDYATGYGDKWMGKEAFQNRKTLPKPEEDYT